MDFAQQDLTTISDFHSILTAQPASVPLDMLEGYVDAVERLQSTDIGWTSHTASAETPESSSIVLDAFDAIIRANSNRTPFTVSVYLAAIAVFALAIVALTPGASP